jgi:hypothetical protein
MKRTPIKLTVRRETIRRLAKHELPDAVDAVHTTCTGETMQASGCPALP